MKKARRGKGQAARENAKGLLYRPGPKRSSWQLQTAKARFSELVRRAHSEGPQWVTRQGQTAVVVIASEQFEQLSRRASGPERLAEFFASSPLSNTPLRLDRRSDVGRMIDL